MEKRQAKGFFDSIRIKKLYKISFPRAERKPYSVIKQMQKEGRGDLWVYEDQGKFLGFATTINGANAVLADIFLQQIPSCSNRCFQDRKEGNCQKQYCLCILQAIRYL